jgi:hypothetical protein
MGILLWILTLWVLLNVTLVGLRLVASGRPQGLQYGTSEAVTFWMPAGSE